MTGIIQYVSEHKALAAFVGMAIIGWLAFLVIIPVTVSSLPTDLFSCEKDPLEADEMDNPISPTMPTRFFRNALALFLIFVVPILFQSIFAPIIGFAIGTFKWKYRVLKQLGRSERIVRALNSIRAQYNRPPFTLPETSEPRNSGT